MSKWNVKTADGRVQDAKAIIGHQQIDPSALEANNPGFSSPTYGGKFGLPEDYVEKTSNGGCLVRCGALLETRRCIIALVVIGFLVVVAVILVAVLFPRFPTIAIDRSETADNMKVDKDSLGDDIWRVFGNMTLIINNANVYSISLADMTVDVTIGKEAPNQLKIVQTIDSLEIPASGSSRHRIPIDIVIPPTVDKTALATEITTECVKNLNKIATLVTSRGKVTVLGTTIDYSFGPSLFDGRCI